MQRHNWEAGTWEQDDDGRFVPWSCHCTEEAARRAAVRYARGIRQRAGGYLSWAGGVRAPDGSLAWYDRDGETL